MLKSLYLQAKEWVGRLSSQNGRRSRPPTRLGCVDVEIFATPRSEDEVSFLQRVEQLKEAQQGDRPLPNGLIDYFAYRFHRLDIPEILGCPFDVYLKRPMVVESIRHDLADSSDSDR